MTRPLGKQIGVVWSLQLHPDDSKDLEAGLIAQGYDATKEGLADFIFDHLKKKTKKKSDPDFVEKIAEAMQDPVKAALIKKGLSSLFRTPFRR